MAKRKTSKKKKDASLLDRVTTNATKTNGMPRSRAKQKQQSTPAPKKRTHVTKHKHKKPSGKKQKFHLRMPRVDKIGSCRDMPWYTSVHSRKQIEKEEAVDTPPSDRNQKQQLPTSLFPESTFKQLDQELEAFASYVRLQPVEREARTHLIQHVTEVATSLFAKNNNGETVCAQAFGSHATPQVCCFASDVDLALWGVVPIQQQQQQQGEKQDAWQTRNDAKLSNSTNDDDVQVIVPAKVAAAAANKREARIRQWRTALAVQDAATITDSSTSESEVAATVDSKTTENTNQVEDNSPAETNTQPGFEIISVLGVSKETAIVIDDPIDDDSSNDVTNAQSSSGNAIIHCPQDVVVVEEQPFESGSDKSFTRTASSETCLVATADQNDSSSASQIAVDLCSDDSDNDNGQSDVDSADKMEAYCRRSRKRTLSDLHADHDDDDGARWKALVVQQQEEHDEMSSDEDDNEQEEESANGLEKSSDMTVSFVSHNLPQHRQETVGPSGETRREVVSALKTLGRKMQKCSMTHTVEVRKFARVPIIAMTTNLGFEGDVAIGGHNGTDTSQYASTQANKYKSFSSVVLLLKILLLQQNLDKPFSGGLGSYKLYVLVAHHLEQHLAIGGSDRPSEILLSFLFRYSGIRNIPDMDRRATTRLSSNVTLCSNGGSADLKPVFNLEHCTRLFCVCWERLLSSSNKNRGESMLGSLVDVKQLRRDRQACARKAAQWRKRKDVPVHGKKQGHVFVKRDSSASSRRKRNYQDYALDDDEEAERIMAGYGLCRRGDLKARHGQNNKTTGTSHSRRKDPVTSLFGSLNRGNGEKKHQHGESRRNKRKRQRQS